MRVWGGGGLSRDKEQGRAGQGAGGADGGRGRTQRGIRRHEWQNAPPRVVHGAQGARHAVSPLPVHHHRVDERRYEDRVHDVAECRGALRNGTAGDGGGKRGELLVVCVRTARAVETGAEEVCLAADEAAFRPAAEREREADGPEEERSDADVQHTLQINVFLLKRRLRDGGAEEGLGWRGTACRQAIGETTGGERGWVARLGCAGQQSKKDEVYNSQSCDRRQRGGTRTRTQPTSSMAKHSCMMNTSVPHTR